MKRAIGFAVWLVLMMGSPTAYADCNDFRQLVVHGIEARMDGRKIKHVATNQMEQDMLNNLFQVPGYRGAKERKQAIKIFVADWMNACRTGVYNFKH